MKKFLFPICALLFLTSCQKDDIAVNPFDPLVNEDKYFFVDHDSSKTYLEILETAPKSRTSFSEYCLKTATGQVLETKDAICGKDVKKMDITEVTYVLWDKTTTPATAVYRKHTVVPGDSMILRYIIIAKGGHVHDTVMLQREAVF